MDWIDLNEEVKEILQGKTPDDIISWADNVTDLDTAKDRIKKLSLIVLWIIYNHNFRLGDKS